MTNDTKTRTILKALSWRMLGTATTIVVAWVITGEIKVAAGLGITDALIKLVLYYLHERVWLHVWFGREEYRQ